MCYVIFPHFLSILIREVIHMSNDEFIITPREDKTVTMSIRIEKILQEQLDELARKSNRSRNEIINMALEYALKNVKFIDSTND
ncbi:Ribbon-helix-helix protein, copG family [compost metagenome]